MALGNSREMAENKIILLYMIERIGLPVSNLQITKLILENKFMNYFLLQQFLNELCDSNLLTSTTKEDKVFYVLTESGKQTLDYFINLIPFGIKGRIDSSIPAIRRHLKNETLITADFIPEKENEYAVICKVLEGDLALIDIKLTVGSKNDARSICNNWKKHLQAIYSEIIESLTKDRDTDKGAGSEDSNDTGSPDSTGNNDKTKEQV